MKLFIGDTSQELADYVRSIHPEAVLLDQGTLGQECAVGYTALGDLSFDQIKELAFSASQVVAVQDLPWHDGKAWASTQILLNHLGHFIQIDNHPDPIVETWTTVPVTRLYNEPTVWTFGCNYTAGLGLGDPDLECYGSLVAQYLNMPFQNISQPGSSTQWSLTHLLNADIQKNDIVIWGTTDERRDRIAVDQIIEQTFYVDERFTDQQMFFEHTDLVNTGVIYLRSQGIKFVLLSFVGESPRRLPIEQQFSGYPEWCPLLDWHFESSEGHETHLTSLEHIEVANRILNHVHLLTYV